MQTVFNPHPFFSFSPVTLNPKPPKPYPNVIPVFSNPLAGKFAVKCFEAYSEEVRYSETFIERYNQAGDEEIEIETLRRNWIEKGWAPWDEILCPENQFARTSLNEPQEEALQNPDSIEAFKMLKASYRRKKMKESGLTEGEFYARQFEIKGEIPEPLKTKWAGPLVLRHVPPRDWPPRGWEVDKKELEFIREAHTMMAVRVDIEQVENEARTNTDDMCLDRYKMFLKQYKEWVAANKDRLEKESYEFDQDYYPGRRKRGKDYKEGMYELPFYYPGQICVGKVTTLHLYQGAFVDIGGVHDGWVPIQRNDWFWIRHHIKVGMHVLVEILAKRDPYRFRFPIEMRFVDPNIDHLIYHRFDFPPIFHREDEKSAEDLRRDAGRPPILTKDYGVKVEEEPLLSNHPYVDKLWLLHNAEQMILDDMESNPDNYKGKKLFELTDDEEFDEEDSIEATEVPYKFATLPKITMKVSVKDLDLEAAFAERQHHYELKKQAMARGERHYKIHKLRRNEEMDEYDLVHWRRSLEEREALLRDISSRRATGLPLIEPGRYVTISKRDEPDPYRLDSSDNWVQHKHSEKSMIEKEAEKHNKSVAGMAKVWYEMPYEECIKRQERRQALGVKPRELDAEDEDEDDDSDDEFDFSILEQLDDDDEPVVNGTESSQISDEGMFED